MEIQLQQLEQLQLFNKFNLKFKINQNTDINNNTTIKSKQKQKKKRLLMNFNDKKKFFSFAVLKTHIYDNLFNFIIIFFIF